MALNQSPLALDKMSVIQRIKFFEKTQTQPTILSRNTFNPKSEKFTHIRNPIQNYKIKNFPKNNLRHPQNQNLIEPQFQSNRTIDEDVSFSALTKLFLGYNNSNILETTVGCVNLTQSSIKDVTFGDLQTVDELKEINLDEIEKHVISAQKKDDRKDSGVSDMKGEVASFSKSFLASKDELNVNTIDENDKKDYANNERNDKHDSSEHDSEKDSLLELSLDISCKEFLRDIHTRNNSNVNAKNSLNRSTDLDFDNHNSFNELPYSHKTNDFSLINDSRNELTKIINEYSHQSFEFSARIKNLYESHSILDINYENSDPSLIDNMNNDSIDNFVDISNVSMNELVEKYEVEKSESKNLSLKNMSLNTVLETIEELNESIASNDPYEVYESTPVKTKFKKSEYLSRFQPCQSPVFSKSFHQKYMKRQVGVPNLYRAQHLDGSLKCGSPRICKSYNKSIQKNEVSCCIEATESMLNFEFPVKNNSKSDLKQSNGNQTQIPSTPVSLRKAKNTMSELETERELLLDQISKNLNTEDDRTNDSIDASLTSKWLNLVMERDSLLRSTHCMENRHALKQNLALLKSIAEETLFLAVCPDPAIQELNKTLKNLLNQFPPLYNHFNNCEPRSFTCNAHQNPCKVMTPPVLRAMRTGNLENCSPAKKSSPLKRSFHMIDKQIPERTELASLKEEDEQIMISNGYLGPDLLATVPYEFDNGDNISLIMNKIKDCTPFTCASPNKKSRVIEEKVDFSI